MADMNTCDRCKKEFDSEELVWITSEDFEPKQGEVIDDTKIQEDYDALCEQCYLGILK